MWTMRNHPCAKSCSLPQIPALKGTRVYETYQLQNKRFKKTNKQNNKLKSQNPAQAPGKATSQSMWEERE